jgi:hypothetical protein
MSFGLDDVGQNIIKAINAEIDLNNWIQKKREDNKLIKKAKEIDEEIILENSIRREVKEEILKYLHFAILGNE